MAIFGGFVFVAPVDLADAQIMLQACEEGVEVFDSVTSAYARAKAGIDFYTQEAERIINKGNKDPRMVDPMDLEAEKRQRHQPQ